MPLKLPQRLPLLDGLRWRGHLTIKSSDARGYLVEFDAVVVKPCATPIVYDVAVLTPKQIHDWTGWRAP